MSNGRRLLAHGPSSNAADERGGWDGLGLERRRNRHGLARSRAIAISGAECAAPARTASHACARAMGPAKSRKIVQKWATTSVGQHSTHRSGELGRTGQIEAAEAHLP